MNIPHIKALHDDYIKIYDSNEFKDIRRKNEKGRDIDCQHISSIANEQQKILSLMETTLEGTSSDRTSFEFSVNIIAVVRKGNVCEEKLDALNLSHFLLYQIFGMIKAGIKIKKCKYCKKYFREDDKRVNYCNRPAPAYGDKTCAEIGPDKLFIESKDERYTAYRLAYIRNRTRKNRGTLTDEEYGFWNEKAIQKRDSNSSDFDEWINLSRAVIKSKFIKSKG